MTAPNHILVAPLDWGLGHATRCIPIIRYLHVLGYEVLIASSGGALRLLKQEFPALKAIELKGYEPAYPKDSNMVRSMFMQLPKFISAINAEHKALKQLIKKHQIDAVISDNRYGMSNKHVPCVMINHQLNIFMPGSYKWIEPLIARINNDFLKKYDEIWVPDDEQHSLTGQLAMNKRLKNVHCLGPLCRLEPIPTAAFKYDLLVLLSGPEPQRSIFESTLLEQLKLIDLRILFVRGVVTDKPVSLNVPSHVEIMQYLNTKEAEQRMSESMVVLARAGYSTIMDLIALKKSAILVPTPGQTEQEYLAKRLSQQGYFYSEEQSQFDLKHALEQVKRYSAPQGINFRGFEKVVDTFISRL